MSILQAFSAIGLPVMMAIGAIAAWRMTKKESTRDEQYGWRDDSLDVARGPLQWNGDLLRGERNDQRFSEHRTHR